MTGTKKSPFFVACDAARDAINRELASWAGAAKAEDYGSRRGTKNTLYFAIVDVSNGPGRGFVCGNAEVVFAGDVNYAPTPEIVSVKTRPVV